MFLCSQKIILCIKLVYKFDPKTIFLLALIVLEWHPGKFDLQLVKTFGFWYYCLLPFRYQTYCIQLNYTIHCCKVDILTFLGVYSLYGLIRISLGKKDLTDRTQIAKIRSFPVYCHIAGKYGKTSYHKLRWLSPYVKKA